MELDTVGYRFREEELCALALLLGYDSIQSLGLYHTDAINIPGTMSGLEEAGYVVSEDGRYYVDDVSAMFAECLCACERFLSAQTNREQLTLYKMNGLCLMAQRVRGGYILKPSPDAEGLRGEIEQALMGEERIEFSVHTEAEHKKLNGTADDVYRQYRML